MLDQNTDRMWFVIGAVIVGAAIIFIANGTLPDVFASVTESFDTSANEALTLIGDIGSNNIIFQLGHHNHSGVGSSLQGLSIGQHKTSVVAKNIKVQPNTRYQLRYKMDNPYPQMFVLTLKDKTLDQTHNAIYGDSVRSRELLFSKFDRHYSRGNTIVSEFTTNSEENYIALTTGNNSPSQPNQPYSIDYENIELRELN